MSSKVQSIHFSKDYWSSTTSKRKLLDMGYRPLKRVHITPHFFEYRIRDPNEFKRFVTLQKRNGIQIVVGFYT